MAMDGRYAGNAGAFSGGCLDGTTPGNEAGASDLYAGNAGAFSGGCLHGTTPGNEADASDPYAENAGRIFRRVPAWHDPGKRRAGVSMPRYTEYAGAVSGLQLPQVTDGSFMFLRRHIARVTILDRFRRWQ